MDVYPKDPILVGFVLTLNLEVASILAYALKMNLGFLNVNNMFYMICM